MKPNITSMTPQEAKSFRGYSVANALQAEASLTCGCKAYEDIYTYRCWQAQGMQVRRGEKAIKLPVVVDRVVEDENGELRQTHSLFSSAVFCRCQVEPK
jgi:antirestriction protein ArdC